MKSVTLWFICWNLALFGRWLAHSVSLGLASYNEIILWSQSCVDLILGCNLGNILSSHTFVCLIDLFGVFVQIISPFGS
jgi:hypothetical protein